MFVIVWPDPDMSFHRKVRPGCCYDDITERERERDVVCCVYTTDVTRTLGGGTAQHWTGLEWSVRGGRTKVTVCTPLALAGCTTYVSPGRGVCRRELE